jgi:hypothetical protein
MKLCNVTEHFMSVRNKIACPWRTSGVEALFKTNCRGEYMDSREKEREARAY